MGARKRQTRTQRVSDFFNSLLIHREVCFAKNSEYEQRLKREGKWSTAHHVDPEDLDADIFNNNEHLDCFYNGVPIDDVVLSVPERGDGEPLGGPLTEEDWAKVAFAHHIIAFVTRGLQPSVHKAPNGIHFTVRDLYEAVLVHTRREVRLEAIDKEFSPDHCFFDGIERSEDGEFIVDWGS